MLLRGMLSATTYFCDAYASWQKGGIENANGRIRRWLPRRDGCGALAGRAGHRHPGLRRRNIRVTEGETARGPQGETLLRELGE